MKSRHLIPIHEVAKLEYQYKFFFFLRDLGIKSAVTPSILMWDRYTLVQTELMMGQDDLFEYK